MKKLAFLFFLGFICVGWMQAEQNFLESKNAYLGLSPPGITPEVFAPSIISGIGRLHTAPAFSNDNKEIYWMVLPPQIMTMNQNSDGWTNPVRAGFSTGSNNQAPFVAHDGKIYFASLRTKGNGSLDIWYVNKSDTGYSEPINIGSNVNSKSSESMPSVSNSNTLFFSANFEGKLYNRGIFYSRFENGEYQSPIALPEQININNKNNLDYTPFIAADESYLLFSSNRQNPDKELCHIYISYKDKNGEWGKPIDLSLKMNFMESSKFPYVTPDNKYLFFSSGSNLYWVSADIIKGNTRSEIANQKCTNTKTYYLAQTPPGDIPEVFAPNIASDTTWAEHCQLAVSPKGDELFWSAWTASLKTEDGKRNTEQIYFSKFIDGSWSEPQIAEFTKNNPHGLNGGPVYSPDGNRLYFYQVRSPWISSPKRCYYIEKTDGKWGTKLTDVGEPYSTESNNYSPVFTQNGHAYKNERGNILRFSYKDDKFTLLDTIVIHKEFRPAWNIYVSPKEDYIIFASKHKDGFGDIDLYISFKNEENNWDYPINLGPEINTDLRERFPIVSPDGKYLFFMRHTKTQDFFWVSTDVIKNLKLKNED